MYIATCLQCISYSKLIFGVNGENYPTVPTSQWYNCQNLHKLAKLQGRPL